MTATAPMSCGSGWAALGEPLGDDYSRGARDPSGQQPIEVEGYPAASIYNARDSCDALSVLRRNEAS
jgi:hypothetical protein